VGTGAVGLGVEVLGWTGAAAVVVVVVVVVEATGAVVVEVVVVALGATGCSQSRPHFQALLALRSAIKGKCERLLPSPRWRYRRCPG
jgi:hypothetical protein